MVPQQKHMYPTALIGLLAIGCIDHHASLFSHIANKNTRLTDKSLLYVLAAMHKAIAMRYKYWPCRKEILSDGKGLCGLEILSSSKPIICASDRWSVSASQVDLTCLVFYLMKLC
jgi:hypothetical protein